MLQQGATLAGYRIESIAGIGGMGVVYKATQLSLDRPVALKVLSSTLVGNHSFRERFRREGRHAAALEHPNIIPVYEAGESNGLMFIAMRLVDGPTLADVMLGQSVSGREALRIVGAIASALDAAHEAGLVHRDVKPQNILLTAAGHPYLADFGITKGTATGGLTRTGDFVGSLSYVAPEQMEGLEVGPASDIYSLAAVLYQCLTGALPYERETDAALMHAHLFAPPPTVSELGVDAPKELDEAFTRAFAKRPADRFGAAGELVEACAAALEVLPPEALDKAPALAPDSPDDEQERVAREAASRAALEARKAELASHSAPSGAAGSAIAQPADHTAADRKRQAPERTEEAPPRAPARAPRRGLLIGGAAALLLAAPVVGYALGGGSGDGPVTRTAKSTAVNVSYGADWRPAQGSIPGLALRGDVGLVHGSGVVLAAGRVKDPAPGLDPAPAAFRNAFDDGAKSVPAKLGQRSVLRYAGSLKSGGNAWVTFFPDTKGWSAVGCRSAATVELESRCRAIAASVESPGVEPIELAPDKALGAALATMVKSLGKVRLDQRERLTAKAVDKRVTAARALADAHEAGVRTLAAVSVRPQDKALVKSLTSALADEAEAFSRMESAAEDRDRTRYARATAAAKRADARVAKALDSMRRGGYVVAKS